MNGIAKYKMIIANLFENDNDGTMSLWHGGRGLEFTYDTMLPHKKGRWEHGPGLYLTTHFDTASKYAKGGGKVYLVTIAKGTNIKDVFVSVSDAIDFTKRYVIAKHKQNIIDDLENIAKRRSDNMVPLVSLSNLCLNYEALSSNNTIALRNFLVENGADYEISTRFGGRDETVIIVFNPKIIKSVKPIKTSDVDSSERVKTVTEIQK